MNGIEEDKISEIDLSSEINNGLKKYQQGKLIGKGKYSKCYEFIDFLSFI